MLLNFFLHNFICNYYLYKHICSLFIRSISLSLSQSCEQFSCYELWICYREQCYIMLVINWSLYWFCFLVLYTMFMFSSVRCLYAAIQQSNFRGVNNFIDIFLSVQGIIYLLSTPKMLQLEKKNFLNTQYKCRKTTIYSIFTVRQCSTCIVDADSHPQVVWLYNLENADNCEWPLQLYALHYVVCFIIMSAQCESISARDVCSVDFATKCIMLSHTRKPHQ